MPPGCRTRQFRRPTKALSRDAALRFEFVLARDLGMTRAELLLRMSGSEFAHWMALYQLEHREQQRAQQHAEDRAKAERMARSMRGH